MNERDPLGSNGASGGQGTNGADRHLDVELLSAYRDRAARGDDVLDPIAYAAAGAHLSGCERCRATLRELDATVALLRDLPQLAPRRSFILTPELIAAAGGRAPRERRRFAWVWPVRWASAVAALLFALTVGLDRGAAPSQQTTGVVLSTAATAAITAPATFSTLTFSTPTFPDDTPPVWAFSSFTPTVYPTPTAVPTPTPAPVGTTTADLWPVEVFLGSLASILALFGFALPPLLRRRHPAA